MFEFVKFLTLDLIFMGLLAGGLLLLAMYSKPAFAVLKRNFVGYFSNPTGYVFLCLFVLLTSLAAFWPHDFFVSNLANLDQLNRWLPQIMLIFIPAITMSIWSEERRQGTDELLLTLPATDFDIVIGKYLAAAMIFTCSLVFSQISNYLVLLTLAQGDVDTGLLFTTYLGYWCIGLTMLSLGMVASFLTKNLTVGFILGMLFNAPLAFASYLTSMVSNPDYTAWFTRWSLSSQFDDFGRGVISLSSISFFALVTGIGLYLSMIMIGSRHWIGGRDGESLIGHFLVRAAALVVILLGLNVALTNYDLLRVDTTQGKVSSLSPRTKDLIKKLGSDRTVVVDAFLSREVPEDYVKTKYTIISMLKELQRLSNGKIQVKIRDSLEAFDQEATKAEEQFGIKPTPVRFASKGAIRDQEILLGAAFSSGLEKVVVPFFDYGIPVEYELVRSISTVSRSERKRLGIIQTDARLNGGFDMGGGMMPRQIPKQAIVEELEKQYKVEEVDLSQPVDRTKFDVLLAVQPSSLGPQQLNHLVEAVKDGMPTAIFEDPMPRVIATTVGTLAPKPPQGGMFGGGGPPPPKGDMQALWGLLGIQQIGTDDAPPADKIVWQRYNPYPRLEQLTGLGPELVFVRNQIPQSTNRSFNEVDSITSGLEELLFPFAGAIQSTGKGSSLKLTELVTTGKDIVTGVAKVEDFMGRGGPVSAAERYGFPTKKAYIMAGRITGELKDGNKAGKAEGEGEKPAAKDGEKEGTGKKIDVVYVTDIDMLDSQFVMFRNSRDRINDDFNFRFDNVTFVLNIIDSLAQDDRFIEIRKRKPKFSTLRLIEATVSKAREKELTAVEGFQNEFKAAIEAEEAKAKKEYQELESKMQALDRRRQDGEVVDPDEYRAAKTRFELVKEAAQRRLEVVRASKKQENEKKQLGIRRDTDRSIQSTQNWCKFCAVTLPSIPPLVIGLVVFLYRRLREREGISRTRRK